MKGIACAATAQTRGDQAAVITSPHATTAARALCDTGRI
jgi:hypothetical protein